MRLADQWVVWSYEHDSWWAPDHAGYRNDLLLAGIYTEVEAKRIEASANAHVDDRERWPSGHEKAMSVADALIITQNGWPTQDTVGEILTTPFESRDHLRIRGAVKMIGDLSYGQASKTAVQRLLAIADIIETMEKPDA